MFAESPYYCSEHYEHIQRTRVDGDFNRLGPCPSIPLCVEEVMEEYEGDAIKAISNVTTPPRERVQLCRDFENRCNLA